MSCTKTLDVRDLSVNCLSVLRRESTTLRAGESCLSADSPLAAHLSAICKPSDGECCLISAEFSDLVITYAQHYIRCWMLNDHLQDSLTLEPSQQIDTLFPAIMSAVPSISLRDFDVRRDEIISELMDASMNVGFL